MPSPTFILLYVDDPATSADFYAKLLGRQPIEQSPTFAMFALDANLMLGLWVKGGVEPAPEGARSEIAFTVADDAAVDRRFDEWRDKGAAILQQPTVLDFGRSFVASDPDGHRLRVFSPSPE